MHKSTNDSRICFLSPSFQNTGVADSFQITQHRIVTQKNAIMDANLAKNKKKKRCFVTFVNFFLLCIRAFSNAEISRRGCEKH